jgi:hypothetical protein
VRLAAIAITTGTGARLGAQAPAEADSASRASPPGSASWSPQVLGTQINVIAQRLAPFHSPYEGPNSLTAGGDHAVSHAYGVYLGVRPFASPRARTSLDAYLDAEMIRGRGVSRTVGLAGLTNGDVIRQGSADLGSGPYVARAFVRLTRGLGTRRDTLPRAPDQLPGIVARHRVEVTLGKLAASDLFDVNRYANSTRQQFMNWGLFQNTAWDFAADTRGYTNGVATAWITPTWTLRAGSFQMPTQANGNRFDPSLRRAHGDQAEVTVTPTWPALGSRAPTVRVLAYVNHARMGDYAEALARARVRDTVPDIVADDRPGRRKTGWGVNVEQPLADAGETGVFLRIGANDGRTESFAFTEVERHLSGGAQVSGARWGRPDDRLAVGVVRHALSALHRAYLAAGGSGFLLGDGRLTYGPEEIAEAYYRLQIGPYARVSPDVQVAAHPGYNRDRGPVMVGGIRVNLRY